MTGDMRSLADAPGRPDPDSALCECGHMRGIHKARDQRPCATAGCGCKQFRTGGASALPEPPSAVRGIVEREPLPVTEAAGNGLAANPGFRPYVHGATAGSPSKGNPEKVLAGIKAGVTEAGRRPRPGSAEDDLGDIVYRQRDPEPQPARAMANFAVHLNARMRALGWDAAALSEKSGLSAHITGRAVNGTAVDLGTAEKLAALVGGYLATMIGPYMCSTCAGEPPAGFSCLECSAEARPS